MPARYRNVFEVVTRTIVADTYTDGPGMRRHLKQSAGALGSRVIILSGSHGDPDEGRDALNDIEALCPGSQTRGFYSEWCKKEFNEEAEGEDPRMYDEETEKVSGIRKDVSPPCWKSMTKTIRGHEISFKVKFQIQLAPII